MYSNIFPLFAQLGLVTLGVALLMIVATAALAEGLRRAMNAAQAHRRRPRAVRRFLPRGPLAFRHPLRRGV